MDNMHSVRWRGAPNFKEPINMKILALEKSARSEFDFKSFSEELRKLSDRYGVQIVSLGAMSGMGSTDETTYLAIWKHKPNG